MQCRSRPGPCSYSKRPGHQSKSNLRQEAESLRQSLRDSDDIIAALRYSSHSTQVLHGLQNGLSNRQILEMLKFPAFKPYMAALETIIEVPGGTECKGEWNGGSSDDTTMDGASGGASPNTTGTALAGNGLDLWPCMWTAQPILPEAATHLPEHAILMSNDPCLCVWAA